jgi:hypothetical protein
MIGGVLLIIHDYVVVTVMLLIKEDRGTKIKANGRGDRGQSRIFCRHYYQYVLRRSVFTRSQACYLMISGGALVATKDARFIAIDDDGERQPHINRERKAGIGSRRRRR